MAVIGIVGPHAIGKTTAAYRWLERYPGKYFSYLFCRIYNRLNHQRLHAQ